MALSLLILIYSFFFFFSSRRRHTRWTGDWSSDVCSSDLRGRCRRRRFGARVAARGAEAGNGEAAGDEQALAQEGSTRDLTCFRSAVHHCISSRRSRVRLDLDVSGRHSGHGLRLGTVRERGGAPVVLAVVVAALPTEADLLHGHREVTLEDDWVRQVPP